MKQVISSLLVLVVLLSAGCQKSAQEELAEKTLRDQKAFKEDFDRKSAAERQKYDERQKKLEGQPK